MLDLMFKSYRVVIPAFLANNDLMNPGYCGLHVRDFFYLCDDESSIMYQWFIESIPVSGFLPDIAIYRERAFCVQTCVRALKKSLANH